jgi:hypothetical protein
MMESSPAFIQGVYAFHGAGYDKPVPLEGATYTVPGDKRSQTIYLRAGHTLSSMICVILLRGGKPMRYFPIGANGAVHVPLAVTEDLFPETKIELVVAAPAGADGTVIIDLGLMEI